MKKLCLPLPGIVLLLLSCGPSAKISSSANYPPLPENTPVAVLNVNQQAPQDAAAVGTLKIGDTGFSMDCDYPTVIARAKREALAMGGNVVKITKHKQPNLASTCHRIWADIYLARTDGTDAHDPALALAFAPKFTIDSVLLAENCAVLHFYRSRNFQGSAISYNVRIGDEVVWRAANNRKEWIKVEASGVTEITAKTESEQQLVIDIQPGRRYYIKCGIGMGIMVGRPTFELVDEAVGRYEFDEIETK